MTEIKTQMPLFRNNFLLTPKQNETSTALIEFVPKKFFQLNFNKLKSDKPLREVQKIRWGVEKKLSEEKSLTPEELTGLRLATSIASRIDLIYYYKLKGDRTKLLKESNDLSKQINDLLGSKSEFRDFLRKHKHWKETLILIKDYASNQLKKRDFSKSINIRSSKLAINMGNTKGPQLYFLPLEENPEILGEQTKKESFMPQLLFTLPVDKTKYSHPLEVTHHNIFYGYILLQAGSALRWEQSGVAIDGGALFLVNNFVGNYDKIIEASVKIAKKYGIIISKEEMWQIFADVILLHEIGHSNRFEKIDPNMGDWTEWLANVFMYGKSIDVIKRKEEPERIKIIFALMAQVDLNKVRLKDPESKDYIDSELLFMYFLIKTRLINMEDFSIKPDLDKLDNFKQLIFGSCKFEHLDTALKEIKSNKHKIINFWQKYFKN